ncbi:hypothetical protein BROUX41_003626 [Berkeleyomyces rouxiae]|uniref:uncharacterized protein n=1 Tax=Berkeleyomyces rouxiae TaxID=2035830 RepID=UPI003B7DED57
MSRLLRLSLRATQVYRLASQPATLVPARPFTGSASRQNDPTEELAKHNAQGLSPSDNHTGSSAEAPVASNESNSDAEPVSTLADMLPEPERTISTITPTEKRVFGEIFDSLAAAKQVKVSSLFEKSPRRRRRNPWSREEILQMYPPSLRRAVEGSFLEEHRTREDEVQEIELTPAEKQRLADLDAQRVTEVQRIKGLLDACTTDQAVWAVLEDQVFPQVQTLGLSPGQSANAPPSTSPDSNTTASLEVHGPIFSQHILTAAQRLAYDFAQPSALALAILPRLKQLGLAAYVLGASTPLYDELLRVSWVLHGSIPEIIELVQRMRDDGLAYSVATLRAVDEIAVQMTEVKDATNNFAEPVLGLPMFDVQARKALMRQYTLIEAAVNTAHDEAEHETVRI